MLTHGVAYLFDCWDLMRSVRFSGQERDGGGVEVPQPLVHTSSKMPKLRVSTESAAEGWSPGKYLGYTLSGDIKV